MQGKKIDIRYLKGVGPKKSELLNRLGIRTVEDLLYCLPRRHEDRSKFSTIKNLKIGEYRTLKGKVLKLGAARTRRGMDVFRIVLGDNTGRIHCVWFNQPFLKKFFKIGQELIIYGKAEKYDKLQINHPEYELLKEEKESINIGRIVPVYSLTQDVNQRYIRFLAHEAVKKFLISLKENLPTKIRAKKKLVDFRFAIHGNILWALLIL